MVAAVQKVATSTSSQPASSKAALRMLAATGRKLDAQDPAVVRQTASQFASQLFFAPLLAEVRKFPFGQEFATGGQTEAIFGEQLDQRVADAVTNSSPALVNEILSHFERQSGQPAPGADRVSWPAQEQAQQVSEGQQS